MIRGARLIVNAVLKFHYQVWIRNAVKGGSDRCCRNLAVCFAFYRFPLMRAVLLLLIFSRRTGLGLGKLYRSLYFGTWKLKGDNVLLIAREKF